MAYRRRKARRARFGNQLGGRPGPPKMMLPRPPQPQPGHEIEQRFKRAPDGAIERVVKRKVLPLTQPSQPPGGAQIPIGEGGRPPPGQLGNPQPIRPVIGGGGQLPPHPGTKLPGTMTQKDFIEAIRMLRPKMGVGIEKNFNRIVDYFNRYQTSDQAGGGIGRSSELFTRELLNRLMQAAKADEGQGYTPFVDILEELGLRPPTKEGRPLPEPDPDIIPPFPGEGNPQLPPGLERGTIGPPIPGMPGMPGENELPPGEPPPGGLPPAPTSPEEDPQFGGEYLPENPQLPTHPLGAYTDAEFEANRALTERDMRKQYHDILRQLGYTSAGGDVVPGELEVSAQRQRGDLGRLTDLARLGAKRRGALSGNLWSGYFAEDTAQSEEPYTRSLADLEMALPRQQADLRGQALGLVGGYNLDLYRLLAEAAARRASQLSAPAGFEEVGPNG